MSAPVSLAVVICTFNRTPMLSRVLNALAAQRGAEAVDWSVLVVDNNCTDETASLVDGLSARGEISGLRRIVEPVQGLTPARQSGGLNTEADWIAFVDDDCLLAEDWIAEAGAFLARVPDCGGMGGQVTLEFEVPPPYVASYRWVFAEQEYGDEPRLMDSLVGAGMVVRREALAASGWLDAPLLADGVGERLVSSGDVELGLRVRSAGHPLWYNPACRLRHLIPAHRLSRRYLLRVIYGLGLSSMLSSVLEWSGTFEAWRRETLGLLARRVRTLGRQVLRVVRQRRGLTPALLAGSAAGVFQVLRMGSAQREALMGCASSPQNPPPALSHA